MRLIDADKLMQEIKPLKIVLNGKSILNDDAKDTVLRIIDEQPTTYDIDKVVEELEKLKAEKEMGTSKVVVKECIEIVKQGVR